MHDKHICLIYAGGTIGMGATGAGLAPLPDFPQHLARLLGAYAGELPRYTLVQYEQPLDSANATPADWQMLASDIVARYAGHDGFVVLHGTDTMAYTASALSFMLQGLRKPVILTGSQIPLTDARSDAPQNLIGALQLAASGLLHEVAVCFGQALLRGNRSTKGSAVHFDAFHSPNYPELAQLGMVPEWQRSALLPASPGERFALPPYTPGQVLSWRAAPGAPLASLQALLACRPRALILEAYGAGNLPDRDPALLRTLAAASAAGVVLVARSQCARGGTALGAYAVGAALSGAGVVGAGDMTFEAVYAKLHHLFANGLEPAAVRAALLQNLAGEITA